MQEALVPWYSIEQYFVLLLRLHVGLSDFLGNGMACGEIIAALCRRRRCRRCRRRCCCCDSFVLPQPEPSSASSGTVRRGAWSSGVISWRRMFFSRAVNSDVPEVKCSTVVADGAAEVGTPKNTSNKRGNQKSFCRNFSIFTFR